MMQMGSCAYLRSSVKFQDFTWGGKRLTIISVILYKISNHDFKQKV